MYYFFKNNIHKLKDGMSIAFAVMFLFQGLANAQNLSFMGEGKKNKEPLLIEADNGIEWLAEKKAYIAKGNVKAHQGNIVLTSDILSAYYRDSDNGGSEIWRVEAIGNVTISTPDDTLKAEKVWYLVDDKVFVAKGKNLLLTRKDMKVTANESFEYWEEKNLAVARGKAKVTKGKDKIKASVLASYFDENNKGSLSLNRIEAFDNIHIITPERAIKGDRGVYSEKEKKAIIYDNVKVTQGENQLNGSYAEMDLNTGVSRLLRSSNEKQGSVKGYIVPDSLEESKPVEK